MNAVKNVAASAKAKLQDLARNTNRSFAELLQYYGMERFLYRLSRSEYANRLILKGALMFTVWNAEERRTTLDIDFLAKLRSDEHVMEDVIRRICAVSAIPDGMVFDASRIKGSKIKEGADYEGVRVKFTGFMERTRVPMQIDIAFGDVVYPQPKTIEYPVLLSNPAPKLQGYTMESVIAEKFEAMIKLGLLNSRMKDFYDLWLLARSFPFDGNNVVEAIRRTFHHRETSLPEGAPLFTPEIYDEHSDRQILWKAFLSNNHRIYAPRTLGKAAKAIEEFLCPPLAAMTKQESFKWRWLPPGPWS